ncbi:crotonase/enoyl-CoA hydratase family protein [Aquimarina algicola]|uniref:Enoyl-CoA hydratase n=1 Tax=Aquimarina algicola TaxID=2589995 RepID=A0A504JK34_9FLAO|nr:crotonase/enoyl-CoA hydratase family protein [Aquimarina algicola]TPN86861.1 enoyl-CoA hydratase [Aquimarina algicola]
MRSFGCLDVTYYKEQEMLLWKIKNTGMPNFCLKGLQEFKEFAGWVRDYFSTPDRPLKFIVSASEHHGIYNMGGDLPFFIRNITSGNLSELRKYAHLCIDAIFEIYTSFGLDVLTVALVEGNAYGGGFECVLAHDLIVAEEQVKFCLPENKFNLFPGMGAYSFLYRKLNHKDADIILKNGQIYTARDLYQKGCIDHLIGFEDATFSLLSHIDSIREKFNFEYYHRQCQKIVFPLSKEELIKITDLWVEACMNVHKFDLRKMEALGNAQARKVKVSLSS